MSGRERNLGSVRLTGEVIQDVLLVAGRHDEWFQVHKGIPADAKFVRMAVDESNGRCDLVLVYEHWSFPKVAPGNPVMSLDVPMIRSCTITLDEVEEAHLRRVKRLNPQGLRSE